MPFIGIEGVWQCASEGCTAKARASIPKDEMDVPDILSLVIQLRDEGFEMDGDDWVCWHHSGGKKRAPEPAPVLHEEKT